MADRLSRFWKADPDEVAWGTLNKFAQGLEPLLAKAFLEAIRQGKLALQIEELAKLIKQGDPAWVANIITAGITDGGLDALRNGLRAAISSSADLAVSQAHINIRFDGFNPRAIEEMRNASGALIREISDSTRGAIQEYLTAALREGRNPHDSARDIRDLIGLTDRQARAVSNYRAMLEGGDFKQALTRALRDGRHDRVLERLLADGGQLSKKQIDMQVANYQNRYLIYRSEVIARTESIGALSRGAQLAWIQAEEEGRVKPGDMARYWYVAPGERTCDICREVPRLNPDGVGIRDTFITANGRVDGPTLHPQCRCVVFTRPRYN